MEMAVPCLPFSRGPWILFGPVAGATPPPVAGGDQGYSPLGARIGVAGGDQGSR